MINLLPIEKRKELKKDYYRRLLVMSLLAIFVLVAIFLITVISFYFSIQSRLGAEELLRQAEKDAFADEQVLDKLIIIQEKIGVAKKSSQYLVPSDILSFLNQHLNSGVKYDLIEYRHGIQKASINLEGLASNRQDLVSLSQSFEGDKKIISVISPPSNLLREGNINFSLQLIVNLKTWE